MPERGYSATKDQLDTRLSRIEGQVRGIRGMVEEDRYCIDVLTQINAVQAALDKVALGLLDGHARHCLAGGHGGPTDPDDQADELMGAVGRLLSRSTRRPTRRLLSRMPWAACCCKRLDPCWEKHNDGGISCTTGTTAVQPRGACGSPWR